MKIYIIGSRGFIGTHLSSTARTTFGDAFVINIDPKSDDGRTIEDYDSVEPKSVLVHLAGDSYNNDTLDTSIDDLAALIHTLKLAVASNSAVVVASTSSVSGGSNPHACFAKAAEIYGHHFRQRQLVPVCFLRIYNVYGRYQPNNLVKEALNAAWHSLPLKIHGPNQICDWIHVSDVVDCILKVIQLYAKTKTLPAMVHVGTGRGLPTDMAVSIIEKVTNRSLRVTWLPMKAEQPLVSVAQKVLKDWKASVTFEDGLNRSWVAYAALSISPPGT